MSRRISSRQGVANAHRVRFGRQVLLFPDGVQLGIAKRNEHCVMFGRIEQGDFFKGDERKATERRVRYKFGVDREGDDFVFRLPAEIKMSKARYIPGAEDDKRFFIPASLRGS